MKLIPTEENFSDCVLLMLIISSANWTYLASISTGIDSGHPLAKLSKAVMKN